MASSRARLAAATRKRSMRRAAIGAFAACDEEIDACCSAGLTDGRRRRHGRRAMQATVAKLAAHQAEERARLVQAERLRYSEAFGRIDLGDAIELLARWALNSNACRIPHLLRHLASTGGGALAPM